MPKISHFAQAIAERRRRIRREVDALSFDFLHANVQIALTYAQLASHYSTASQKRIRYAWKARDAYYKVVRLSRRLPGTPEEAEKLQSELRILEDALAELGDGF